MATHEGLYQASPGTRFGIVVSRFNLRVTERLAAGCRDTLVRHGIEESAIDLIWVPGAFEIPGTIHRLTSLPYDALIALGAVVRGDTPHFDYVSGAVATGVATLAREAKIPIIFGVLTTDTMEQAEDRAFGKAGNKGSDAAMTALEMVSLWSQF